MNRLLFPAIVAFAPGLTWGLAAPLAAQDDAGDKVNMVIVYGEDECPAPEAGEITVCARKAEDERFRIPEALRYSDDPRNTAWTQRVEDYEMVGAFGTYSCDPAGAGGFLGCTQQMINAAYKDKRTGSTVRFAKLIEAARAKRLSTIDEDAAAEQERVEQIEREYMERLKKERDADLPGELGVSPKAQSQPPQDATEAAGEGTGDAATKPADKGGDKSAGKTAGKTAKEAKPEPPDGEGD